MKACGILNSNNNNVPVVKDNANDYDAVTNDDNKRNKFGGGYYLLSYSSGFEFRNRLVPAFAIEQEFKQ